VFFYPIVEGFFDRFFAFHFLLNFSKTTATTTPRAREYMRLGDLGTQFSVCVCLILVFYSFVFFAVVSVVFTNFSVFLAYKPILLTTASLFFAVVLR
jgi:hypothetical protein